MSADVQSSPKVVDSHHKSGGGGVQSVPKPTPPPVVPPPQQPPHHRRTSGRIQLQRRSNGAATTVSCGNLGQKDNYKKPGGGPGGSHNHHNSNNNNNCRKRSQSFSGGGGGGVSVGVANGGGVGGVGGGGGGKMFPAYKRRKKDHIIPPTKFLLGGNICDPLNLNSLLDEDINRAMNAVTPKSSPLPTPKHRKGHVEVIIPPNINDPLNLLQMSADGDCNDDYEKSLISPVKGGLGGGGVGGVGGGKKNKRKRRHTKSFSQSKDDSGNDEAGLAAVAAVGASGGEARLHEADKPEEAGQGGSDSTNVAAAMEPASLTRRKNLRLDLEGCGGGGGRDEIKMAAVDDVIQTSPDKGRPTGGCGDVGTTDSPHTPTNPTPSDSVQLATTTPETLMTSSTTLTTPIVTSSALAASATTMTTTKSLTTSKSVTSSTGGGGGKSVTSSSGSGGGIFKKCRKDSKDKIVSPAIPQPGAWGDKSHHHHHHHRFRPHPHQMTPHIDKNQKTPKFKEVNTRFRYGNYNRYYGYRNPTNSHQHHQNQQQQQQQQQQQHVDPRLRVLLRRRDLFESRDVLDIGCNVGHVTLAVARDTQPRSIVGIDIDRQLVDAAKRNVKHYVRSGAGAGTGGATGVDGGKLPYPRAMAAIYGPLDAPRGEPDRHRFPHNVSFVQGNYVLDSDALLSLDERCQFDTILCLSVTKWFHLNWGDAGLKRAFRRMYAQLRPGGKLILEPQPWHSYKKKRNLTAEHAFGLEVHRQCLLGTDDGLPVRKHALPQPEIWNNYKSIELFPHKFSQYLLSEVGFTKCEVVGTPHHHSKGFQRPIKLFTKGELSSAPCSVRTTAVDEGVVTSLESVVTSLVKQRGAEDSVVTSLEGVVTSLGKKDGVVTSLVKERSAEETSLDAKEGVVTSLGEKSVVTSLGENEGVLKLLNSAVMSLGEKEGVVTSLRDRQDGLVTSSDEMKGVVTSLGEERSGEESVMTSLDAKEGVVTSLDSAVTSLGEKDGVVTSLGDKDGVVTSLGGQQEGLMTSLDAKEGVDTSLVKEHSGESVMTSLDAKEGVDTSLVKQHSGESVMTSLYDKEGVMTSLVE